MRDAIGLAETDPERAIAELDAMRAAAIAAGDRTNAIAALKGLQLVSSTIGDIAREEQHLHELCEAEPDRPWHWIALAGLAERRGEPMAACEYIGRARGLAANDEACRQLCVEMEQRIQASTGDTGKT